MPHFSVQISGEPEPRSFQYDTKEEVLKTDVTHREHPLGGMDDQFQAEITEKNANTDPDFYRYWTETKQYRDAYHLCQDEGISFEEAFKQVRLAEHSQSERPELPPVNEERKPYVPPSERHQDVMLFPGHEPEPEQGSDPVAAVLITNQQLLLKIAFQLLNQYVPPEDTNSELVELLKEQVNELNDYEITL